ncbi:DUF5658 family protein [Halorientalis marina]|uniref:DUF5658 family protein n=1 Tax=Halorientalis marina TaxID=2931976 RepID=UPI001FF30717|nr:DUF5658 family protein [Halorientalis marina]
MSTSAPRFPLPTFSVSPPSYTDLVAALVFVWGVGDAVSTLVALALTRDLSLEANPLVRALLAQTPLLLLVMKAAVALVVGVALLRWRDPIQSVPLWRPWMVGVLGLGTAIVVSNLYVGLVAVL